MKGLRHCTRPQTGCSTAKNHFAVLWGFEDEQRNKQIYLYEERMRARYNKEFPKHKHLIQRLETQIAEFITSYVTH